MLRAFALTVALCSLAGCNQSTTSPAASPASAAAAAPAAAQSAQLEAKTAVDARAYIQGHIDRFMGGDQTNKVLLLRGVVGPRVDYAPDSVTIKSCVPAYSDDGKPIENSFKIKMNVQGHDALRGTPVNEDVDHFIYWQGDKWHGIEYGQ